MPDRCAPCTTTEPMSTLTLRFFTPVSDPEITCLQPVPARETFVSCATASGASRASMPTSPTNCGEYFKINHLSFYLSFRTSTSCAEKDLGEPARVACPERRRRVAFFATH